MLDGLFMVGLVVKDGKVKKEVHRRSDRPSCPYGRYPPATRGDQRALTEVATHWLHTLGRQIGSREALPKCDLRFGCFVRKPRAYAGDYSLKRSRDRDLEEIWTNL